MKPIEDLSQELVIAKRKLLSSIEFRTRDNYNPEIGIPGLRIYRKVEPTGPTRYTHQPSVCLIAQGNHARGG